MAFVRLYRPLVQGLKNVTKIRTSHKSPQMLKQILLQTHVPQCWGICRQDRFYTNQNNQKKDSLARDIEELKEMFKDDPQLETWLKELESNDSEKEEKSTIKNEANYSTETELDREMLRYNIEEFYATETDNDLVQRVEEEESLPISTERGREGVFDIEELVELLNIEGLKDICVIHVPESMSYVDYLVLTTGRNLRHIKAAAHYVNWFFKQKRNSKDPPTCTIEGLQSNDWLAMDMGNIVLHLMLHDTRETYDIETLWTVGTEYDDKLLEEEDPFAISHEPEQHKDNLLTLSKQVEYAFEDKMDTYIEEKYKVEKQDMESVTEWHNVKRK